MLVKIKTGAFSAYDPYYRKNVCAEAVEPVNPT